MAIRFDLPEYLQDDDDDLSGYGESPSFPYPVVNGQPGEVDIKKLLFHFSLVTLNLHSSSGTNRLKLIRHRTSTRRKVLLRIP